MPHLRIATVQIEYHPNSRTSDGIPRLAEPLAAPDPLSSPDPTSGFLASLRKARELRNVSERLLRDTQHSYEALLEEKLKTVLNFCLLHDVDIVVLPEYSIPPRLLHVLRRFSSKMVIVAGIGWLRTSDPELLRAAGVENVESLVIGSNAAVLLSPATGLVVSKRHAAQGEEVVAGTGVATVKLELPVGTIRLSVAVCLDFLRDITQLYDDAPNVVAIPALSRETSDFTNTAPRNFARIFSNHSAFGGSYIGVPEIRGSLGLASRNGTNPMPAGVEGLLLVDWDIEAPFSTRPSRIGASTHRFYGSASLLYSGRDPSLGHLQKRLDRIVGEGTPQIHELSQYAASVLDDPSSDRYPEMRRCLQLIGDLRDSATEEELKVLMRHCVLSEEVMTITEWRYQQAVRIGSQLRSLQERLNQPELAAVAFAQYESLARTLATTGLVRSAVLEPRHKGPPSSAPVGEVPTTQYVLVARLGPYDEDQAIESLSRQFAVLRVLADMQDPTLALRYRIRTVTVGPGSTQARFEVFCTTSGKSQSELEALREGLGQIVHVAFAGAYGISYTTSEEGLRETLTEDHVTTRWRAELRFRRATGLQRQVLGGVPDWALVIDLIRSLKQPALIEMECSAAPPSDEYKPEPMLTEGELLGRMGLALESVTESHRASAQMFVSLLRREWNDRRRLRLGIRLSSTEPLPGSITDLIAIEIAGAHPYEIHDLAANASPEGQPEAISSEVYSIIDALRIFHPPYGKIYRTAQGERKSLRITTEEVSFPPGMSLGRAFTRQMRADEDIEVRLSEEDRLRHLYVIGRTGAGKTNLLKHMAAQDVKVPGRGVTIIDPHGDLADHVLREVPESRSNEVVLADLSRTDALPVLNPLSFLGNKDQVERTVRDRTIQELISLLRSRVFHQFTGPRFEEVVRTAFETMLDPGYPVPASFVEIPSLLMDRELQKDLQFILTDTNLKTRWKFQDELARDPEYGGMIHWVTSKFTDIARDATLRCVLGGAPSTIDMGKVVDEGKILVVRIPEAVIGRQAADLIGSLMLLELRMAMIRRREFGAIQHWHFVYVDEFQNFANTDFHTIVAEARKFNIGFTLANQNLEQLRDFRTFTGVHEERLVTAILGNVGNLIAFSVGGIDAQALSVHFGLDADKIMQIGRYEALARILVNGFDTRAFSLRTPEAVRIESPRVVDEIVAFNRDSYWVDQKDMLASVDARISVVRQAVSDAKREAGLNARQHVTGIKEEQAGEVGVRQAQTGDDNIAEVRSGQGAQDRHAIVTADGGERSHAETFTLEQLETMVLARSSPSVATAFVEEIKDIVRARFGVDLQGVDLQSRVVDCYLRFQDFAMEALRKEISAADQTEYDRLLKRAMDGSVDDVGVLEFLAQRVPDFSEKCASLLSDFRLAYLHAD